MRRFTTVKIREALRLKEMDVSNVQISLSMKCGRSTLIDLFRRCDELGLDFSQASQMSNTDLDQLLNPCDRRTKIEQGRRAIIDQVRPE